MPEFGINTHDWYWFVGGDISKAYASARNVFVPPDDTAFVAWKAQYIDAYPIASQKEIWDFYLKDWQPWWLYDDVTNTMAQPAVGLYTKKQLNNYNTEVRTREVNGGMIAAGVPVKTDDLSRQLIQGGRQLAEADPNWTTRWYGSDGNFYDVDSAQMIEMSNVVGEHTNSCYLTFDTVAAGIADNSITLPSQVDAHYVGL